MNANGNLREAKNFLGCRLSQVEAFVGVKMHDFRNTSPVKTDVHRIDMLLKYEDEPCQVVACLKCHFGLNGTNTLALGGIVRQLVENELFTLLRIHGPRGGTTALQSQLLPSSFYSRVTERRILDMHGIQRWVLYLILISYSDKSLLEITRLSVIFSRWYFSRAVIKSSLSTLTDIKNVSYYSVSLIALTHRHCHVDFCPQDCARKA